MASALGRTPQAAPRPARKRPQEAPRSPEAARIPEEALKEASKRPCKEPRRPQDGPNRPRRSPSRGPPHKAPCGAREVRCDKAGQEAGIRRCPMLVPGSFRKTRTRPRYFRKYLRTLLQQRSRNFEVRWSRLLSRRHTFSRASVS